MTNSHFSLTYYYSDKENNIASLIKIDKNKKAYDARALSS